MRPLNVLSGLALILAALLAPPALAANVVAGAIGLVFIGAGAPSAMRPAAPPPLALQAPPVAPRVLRVRGGLVVFEDRDGRLVSRFYPA